MSTVSELWRTALLRSTALSIPGTPKNGQWRFIDLFKCKCVLHMDTHYGLQIKKFYALCGSWQFDMLLPPSPTLPVCTSNSTSFTSSSWSSKMFWSTINPFPLKDKWVLFYISRNHVFYVLSLSKALQTLHACFWCSSCSSCLGFKTGPQRKFRRPSPAVAINHTSFSSKGSPLVSACSLRGKTAIMMCLILQHIMQHNVNAPNNLDQIPSSNSVLQYAYRTCFSLLTFPWHLISPKRTVVAEWSSRFLLSNSAFRLSASCTFLASTKHLYIWLVRFYPFFSSSKACYDFLVVQFHAMLVWPNFPWFPAHDLLIKKAMINKSPANSALFSGSRGCCFSAFFFLSCHKSSAHLQRVSSAPLSKFSLKKKIWTEHMWVEYVGEQYDDVLGGWMDG